MLWKIQKFDWQIPETKWQSCLHNRVLCSQTPIQNSRVEPEKIMNSKPNITTQSIKYPSCSSPLTFVRSEHNSKSVNGVYIWVEVSLHLKAQGFSQGAFIKLRNIVCSDSYACCRSRHNLHHFCFNLVNVYLSRQMKHINRRHISFNIKSISVHPLLWMNVMLDFICMVFAGMWTTLR